MNFKNEFHVAFSKYGGVLQWEGMDLNPMIKITVNRIRLYLENYRRGKIGTPYIYFDVINNSTLNAAACKYNGSYFIGVNYGTILLLNDIFRYILRHSEVLKEVGQPGLESDPEKLYNAQFTDYDSFFHIFEDNANNFPSCEIRNEVAHWMTAKAIMNIVLHEITHIVNGHIDLLNSSRQQISLLEEASNFFYNNDYLLLQTLEYDADCSSTSIQAQKELYLCKHKQNIRPLLQFIYQSEESLLKYLTFSIAVFRRLFGMYYERKQDITHFSHPPSGMRIHWYGATVHTVLQKIESPNANRLGVIISKMIFYVEKVFSIISEQPVNPMALLLTYTQDYLEQNRRIRENWNEIYDLLEPFATVKLAPKQKITLTDINYLDIS